MRALAVALGVAGLAACSSPPAPVGPNGQCMLTTDCQAGLVCVPQKNAPSICTSNLASIVSTEEAGAPAPKDAAAGDGRAPADGSAPAEAGTSPKDAALPDDAPSPTPEAQPPEASVNPTPDATAD